MLESGKISYNYDPMIQFYNTLTKQKEDFKPNEAPRVGIYSCGPTVYDRAHLGNLRAYVFADLLRRWLEKNNFQVTHVINVTDIGHLTSDQDTGEDKMALAVTREGLPMSIESLIKVGEKYTDLFLADIDALNIKHPHHLPRPSNHLAEQIELIKQLEEKGYAYRTSDGVYYDISRFATYGQLGNIDLAAQQESARIESNPEKRNPADFALWKFGPLGWESPWGHGFPGWHLECSAMSMKYLGESFDIHTGGVDHIPVHHNNEIAQSEAVSGKPLAHYWLHNEFIRIDNKKISKSLGNVLTIDDLQSQNISALGYRYWLLTGHYRSPMNLTWEALRAAETTYKKLVDFVVSLEAIAPTLSPDATTWQEKIINALSDDLNTPQALALIWEMIKDSSLSPAEKKAIILDFDQVFGLNLASARQEVVEAPNEVQALIEERERARANQNWPLADELRQRIADQGFELKDTPNGPTIKKI
jgi:cysteinyl-tRNA synthetase